MSLLDEFLNKVKTFDPYPTLYSRTSTGAVQTWKVEVEGPKYRFHTGQKGGAIITSDWTVCQGKNLGRANQTTGEEQASKEAKAAMSKKLKSGGYWENESDIDKVRFFEPMLAYKLKDYRDSVTYPLMVDRKYNGGRVVANREGLKTRKGENYITILHIWNALSGLFAKFPNLVLDGEGYNHDLRFKLNECMSLLRKTKKASPEDIAAAEKVIQYYVYDGYGFTVNGKEITTKELPTTYPIFDIGARTVKSYGKIISKAKSIVISGPMGKYEDNEFNFGTKSVLEQVANSEGFSLAGGGHTIAAIELFKLTDKFSYISTAGGALIEFLMGKKLPGVTALEKAASKRT